MYLNPFGYIPTLATSLLGQYSYKKLTRSGYLWPTPVGNWHPLKWTTRSPKRKPWLWFFALGNWKLYLFKHFDVFTDNQAVLVLYLRSESSLSKRESRLALFLADFHFSTHHISRKDNSADPLSRQVKNDPELEMNNIESSIRTSPRRSRKVMTMIPSCLTSLKDLRTPAEMSFVNAILGMKGNSDSIFLSHLPFVSVYPRPGTTTPDARKSWLPFSGHPGRDWTLWNLSKHFYWPHIGRSVKDFVKSCESCQRSKSSRNKVGLLQPLCRCLTSPGTTFQWISLLAYLSLRGRTMLSLHLWIVWLSAFILFLPLQQSMQRVLLKLYVKHVFSPHGLSKSIVCDRAPRFTASFFKVVFDRLEVKLQMSNANHPNTDSLTERVNRIVEDCLRCFVNPLSAKASFSALAPRWPTFEIDLFFLIAGKITVKMLF